MSGLLFSDLNRYNLYTDMADEVEKLESPSLNWKDTKAKSALWAGEPAHTNFEQRDAILENSRNAVKQFVATSEYAPNDAYGQAQMAYVIASMNPGMDIKNALKIAQGGLLQKELNLQYERKGGVGAAFDTFRNGYWNARAGEAFSLYMMDPNNTDALALAEKYFDKALSFKTAQTGYNWFTDNVLMPYARVSGVSAPGSVGATAIMIGGKVLSAATGYGWIFKLAKAGASLYSGARAGMSQAGMDFYAMYREADANGQKLDMTDPFVRTMFLTDAMVMGVVEVGDFFWSPTYRALSNILTPTALSNAFAKSLWQGLRFTGGQFVFSDFSESAEEFVQGIAGDAIRNAVYNWSNTHNGTAFPIKDWEDIVLDASEAFAQTTVEMIPTVALNMAFTFGVGAVKGAKASRYQSFSYDTKTKQGVLNAQFVVDSEKIRKEALSEIKSEKKTSESGEKTEKTEVKDPEDTKVARIKVVQTDKGAALATPEDVENFKELYKLNGGKKSFNIIIEGVDIDSMQGSKASTMNFLGSIINGDEGNVVGYSDGALIVKDEQGKADVKEQILKQYPRMQDADEDHIVTPIYEGSAQRIAILTQKQAEAQNISVKPLNTWEAQNLQFKSLSRLSNEEAFQQEDIRATLNTLIQKFTGMTEDEVTQAMANDVDSITMKLPDGITWDNLVSSAEFMPIMSQITGRTTEDLLNDNLIHFNITGQTQYVDINTNIPGTYDPKTGKVTFTDGEKTWQYDAKDKQNVTYSGANMQSAVNADKSKSFQINVNKEAAADDLVHELMHVTRSLASKERLTGFIKAYGGEDLWIDDIKDNGDGTYTFNGKTYDNYKDALELARVNEERFRRDFMQYLRDGSAPNAEIKSFFERLKEFLKKFIQTFREALSQDTVAAFDKLINGEVDVNEGQTIEEAVEASDATLTDEVETAAEDISEEEMESYANPEGTMLYSLSEDYNPEKVGHGYKLFEMDTRTGEVYPLFIGKNEPTKVGVWNIAENIPTKGFANRPGWHIGSTYPLAVWLLGRNGLYNSQRGTNFRRVWCEVSYPMDVDYQSELDERGIKDIKDHTPENGYYRFREANGEWIISGALRIDKVLSDAEVKDVLESQGVDYNAMAREQIRKHFKTELPEGYKLYSLADNKQWQTMDANTQRRIDADYERTYNQYYGTDQWMKAPNGQPTKLTERQWVQVRTPAFKEWFGDWENDPENASKVLDDNGEPLVVYRGESSWERHGYVSGLFVSTDERFAEDYGDVQALFVNSRKPFDGTKESEVLRPFVESNFEQLVDDLAADLGDDAYRNPEEMMSAIRDNWWFLYEYGSGIREEILSKGYDSIYIWEENRDNLWLTSPRQVKSATDNNGEFSRDNDSILFSIAPPVESTEFKNWFGGSKVVDENGNPMVVYHGSPIKGIDEFMPTGRTNNGDGLIYTTNEKTVADIFAKEHVEGSSAFRVRFTGNVGETYPLYMDMKHPLDFRNLTDDEKALITKLYAEDWHLTDEIAQKNFDMAYEAGNHQYVKDMARRIVNNLEAYGYDGLIANMLSNWQAEQDGAQYQEYAVPRPEQVKRVAGSAENKLYSLQNNDLPLDFFRNGGTIRYDDKQQIGDSDTGRTSDASGLRGYIEFGVSSGRNNGRLVDWKASGDEVEPEARGSAQRPYLASGDIRGTAGEAGRESVRRGRLLRQLNTVKGSNYVGVFFYELNKSTSTLNKFLTALNYTRDNEKTGVFVSSQTLKALKKDNVHVFMSGDGNTGYAIEYDYEKKKGLNNLVAVFNTSMNGETTKGAVYSILADAIEHGANVLDCYADEKLLHSYSQMGFVPTGTVKFTDQYLSDAEKQKYKQNKLGKPFVVAMRYADVDINDTMSKLAERQKSSWDTDSSISKYDSDGYEAALRERDVLQSDFLFGQDEAYRANPNNYRLGTRVAGAAGPNPNPVSEPTAHGLTNWEKTEGREEIAEKIATTITGGTYKVMKDGTELALPSPIPVKRKARESAVKYLNRVAQYGATNIKTVFDVLTSALKEREKKWYDTAHALAVSIMNKYGLSIGQSSALIAVLSPNYEWTNNYTLADIVADIMINAKDSKPSEQMLQFIRDNYDKWSEKRLEDFASKKLSEMSDDEAKDFIYVAIQSGEIDKSYMASLSIGLGITGQSDQRFGMTIGTGNAILKAVSVMRDGSLTNISTQIGNEAKVRSFYNNILLPGSDRGEITADTWALRDFFLGMNPKYSETMRGILFGGTGGAGTGLTAVVNEGFRIATDMINSESEEKYLPHQIQSIVWTGIKSAWDNVDNSGKREEIEAAWFGGDVQKIRDIFKELIEKHEPQLPDAMPIENMTLSRRSQTASIFREGSSSETYNNLGQLIEESHQATQESARAYSEAGGRKSLGGYTLFSLSSERQAEVIASRKAQIQQAVQSGQFVRTEYLNEFRGEEWADSELAMRDWMLEHPEVIDMAKNADSVEDFKKAYEKSLKKDAEEGAETAEADNGYEDQWFNNIYSYAHAQTIEERDRAFASEWTSSEDKTLELANALRNYKDAMFREKPGTPSGGYWYVKNVYGAFKGVSTKLLRLRDGMTGRLNQRERSSSADIKEAQDLIRQNPSAYRRAYLIAQMAESRAEAVRSGQQENIGAQADQMLLEQIDDDIAREVAEVEEAYEAEKRPKVDYKANISDIRKKISDAESDIRKAGEDPQKFDADRAKEDLQGIRKRLKELNALIRSGEKEVDKIIERMGAKIEGAEDKLEQKRAELKEQKKEYTQKNNEAKRLQKALDAKNRLMEAREVSAYRKKRIKQIKRLSTFNSASVDASFEDSLLWVHGLFDRTEEDIENRKSIDEQIADKKQEIERLSYQNEDTSQAQQDLLNLQKQKKISRMVEPPAQLKMYLPANISTLRADNRQSMWSAEELDQILAALKQMRADAKQMLENRQNSRRNKLLAIAYGYYFEATGNMGSLTEEGEMSSRLLQEDIKKALKEGEKAKGFKWYKLQNAKLQRLSRLLDGDKEGILYDWFVRQNYKLQSQEIDGIRARLERGSEKWKELGLKASTLSKEGYKGTKVNGTEYSLTRGQMIGVYIYSKNELGKEKLMHLNGNEITEASIKEIINSLTAEEKAWGDFMLEDMEQNYSRLADVYYRGWNMNLGQRDNYFTFVPADSVTQENLESMGMDPQGDIVGKDGKVLADRSFTKLVNPNAIYPLDLDVTRTWSRQVRKQEHFIAYGEWAKDSQYLLDQSQIKETMERAYNLTAAKNFQTIVDDVIGGQMASNDFDRAWLRVLASRNSAVLIGNVGTIAKQAPSVFAAFNSDVALRHLINSEATLRNFLEDHPDIAALFPDVNKAVDFIYANAPEMKDRQIDIDIMESLNRMEGGAVENALRTANSKIAKYTMQLVDKLVVNGLWMSRYYTVFDEQKAAGKSDLQAHKEAAFKASQFISETQPTSMRMDQSALQVNAKTSSLLRGIMVFTNQTINTFNQLFFDVPQAFRKDWKKGVQKLVATSLIVGSVALLSGRFIRKGNEDEDKYWWRFAREMAATMLQTAAPGFGSIVSSALEYDSDYSTYIFGLDTIGSSLRKVLTPSKNKDAWDKIADVMINIGTEAGYAIGVPVTPVKNVVKTVKEKNPGYMLNSAWGQIIESHR